MKNSNLLIFMAATVTVSIAVVGEWFFFKELITPFAVFATGGLICENLEKTK